MQAPVQRRALEATRRARVAPLLRRVAPCAWGLCIGAGALWVRLGRPQERYSAVALLLGSETFHVVAHALLYGALALLLRRFLSRRASVVLAVVMGLGLIQELSQSLGARRFGAGEWLDLAVDLLAARVALVLPAGGERKTTRSAG